MSDLIFVALSTFAEHDTAPLRLLENSGYPLRIHRTGKRITTAELARDAADAAVIIAGVELYDAATINNLPALRCISRCGVGVDAIDLPAARQRGITVANTPTIPVQAVAELALTMFLALSRNLRSQGKCMEARQWQKTTGHLLAGRTVGLLGFGRIGQKVAALCRAFDARVLVHDPRTAASTAQELGVVLVEKQQLLNESDIVSLHASKNAGQTVLISAVELSLMKPGSILVNLARGEMVDEAALVEALQSGHIAGAGLDVFCVEPYQGPLCDFNQVILTPHTATLTFETRSAMEFQCVQNALDFLGGKLSADRQVV